MKFLNQILALACVLCPLGIGSISLWPSTTLAQTRTPEIEPIQFAPDLVNRGSPPGRTRGGASRGNCAVDDVQSELTALVPSVQVSLSETEQSGSRFSVNLSSYESVLSLTTATHPSFLFYVPYVLDETITLEFLVQDASGDTLYQTQYVPDEGGSGIVQVSIPETLSPLTVDASYQWYFIAHCNSPSIAETPLVTVNGWIIRIDADPDFQAQLEAASMLEKASFYAAKGIWQDAVATLAELYRKNPQSMVLRDQWASLLASIDLDDISAMPLMECCTVDEAIKSQQL